MPHRSPTWTVPLAAALALLGLGPGSAEGQAGSGAPTSGDWSVLFTIFQPDEVTNLGVYRMVGDRANVGLEVDLSWSDADQRIEQSGVVVRGDGSTWFLAVGPSVRWYGSRSGPVSPFLRTKFSVGWERSHLDVNDQPQSEERTFTVLGSLALGAEWYPLRHLGISGHTGVAWTASDTDSETFTNDRTVRSETSNIRTFRSGLIVSFYFR